MPLVRSRRLIWVCEFPTYCDPTLSNCSGGLKANDYRSLDASQVRRWCNDHWMVKTSLDRSTQRMGDPQASPEEEGSETRREWGGAIYLKI